MGSWFKLFVLLALHFPPCLSPTASCLLSPACIFYGHVKQKFNWSYCSLRVPIIYSFILRRKNFLLRVPETQYKFQFSTQQRHWRDLRKNTLHEFLFCRSVSGSIRRFLTWGQYYNNMASGDMGINPISLIYMGSYLNLKPSVWCCFCALIQDP